MWVAGMDDVLEVDAEVVLMDWEANGSAVEVITTVRIEEVCAVKVMAILVGRGVGEVVMVAEVDGVT
ncbi:hypothetical protein KI387_016175, partial [Taxus chinensis]